MVRIARDDGGNWLIGDDGGFVRAGAVDPALTDRETLFDRAARGQLEVVETPTEPVPAGDIALRSPLGPPGRLIGIGLNYGDHAADLDEDVPSEPATFHKPPNTVVGPGGPIRLPPTELASEITAEAELGVVIGRPCRAVGTERAAAAIAGYVPVIDVTAEDILRRNPRFLTRAKSFDSFLVIGPWIHVPPTEFTVEDVRVRTVRDGDVVAADTVANMRYPPDELVGFNSRVMPLEPGDLITTGTPGAARIHGGETVRAEVEGIGTLSADVVGSGDA